MVARFIASLTIRTYSVELCSMPPRSKCSRMFSISISMTPPPGGRLDDARPWQRAVLAVCLVVNLQIRRRADRLVADVVHAPAQDEAVAVARLALDQVGPHVGPRRERCRRVRVDVAVKFLARHVDAA